MPPAVNQLNKLSVASSNQSNTAKKPNTTQSPSATSNWTNQSGTPVADAKNNGETTNPAMLATVDADPVSREDHTTLDASKTEVPKTTDGTKETPTAPAVDTTPIDQTEDATVLVESGEVKTNASTSRTTAPRSAHATSANKRSALLANNLNKSANAPRSKSASPAKSHNGSANATRSKNADASSNQSGNASNQSGNASNKSGDGSNQSGDAAAAKLSNQSGNAPSKAAIATKSQSGTASRRKLTFATYASNQLTSANALRRGATNAINQLPSADVNNNAETE